MFSIYPIYRLQSPLKILPQIPVWIAVAYTKYSSSLKREIKMSFEAEKRKFLTMSLEEKRASYKKTVQTLQQIATWVQYWKENRVNIQEITLEESTIHNDELASKVSIWIGDITQLEVDVIVNAANRGLLGGGGVDGAIHKAAGPNLKEECRTLAPCEVGEAKITGGYRLPAKYVIHTVGPQGEKPEKLRQCYENSLKLAQENDLRSIAFPCISTGIYGYPQKAAANIALETVKKYLKENGDEIDRVIFCLFLDSDKQIYEELLQKFFPLN